MSFQDEVKQEAAKMAGTANVTLMEIRRLGYAYLADELVAIAEVIILQAAEKRLGAGYSGSRDDGGSGRMMEKLHTYLEGVMTGLANDVTETSPYGYILKELKKKQDPDYQLYLTLKEKFGDKD